MSRALRKAAERVEESVTSNMDIKGFVESTIYPRNIAEGWEKVFGSSWRSRGYDVRILTDYRHESVRIHIHPSRVQKNHVPLNIYTMIHPAHRVTLIIYVSLGFLIGIIFSTFFRF